MLTTRLIVGIFSVALMVVGVGLVSGQDYPNKPVRVIVGSVGGGTDFAARLIAPALASSLGQPVIVDNRGGGMVPGDVVSKAPPDGYTLLCGGSSFVLGGLLQKVPYDTVRDFLPIILVSREPNVLVVHPSLPVNSVKELIALAKARPGEINYASSATGSGTHLSGELFKAMAGVNIVQIPYKGSGPATIGLLGGEAQLMFDGVQSVTPHLKSRRLRALAVTTAEPSVVMPGLPTVAATVAGYEDVGMTSVFAPAKTPALIINRLNQEIVRVLNRADLKEKFLVSGIEVVGSSPEQLAAELKSVTTRMEKVIRDAGIKTN